MLVRLKREIISMGIDEIQPEKQTVPRISPQQLKQWYDDGRDMVVLDTRNAYECALGSFDNAVDLDLDTFRQFPDAIDWVSEEIKSKPVVTFCTGGIRCEKAAELMKRKGFQNVYQLDGGILNYFEQIGGEHWHGECFVFDKRVALNTQLQETDTTQCYACRQVLTIDQQSASECPHCQHMRDSRAGVNDITGVV